MLVDTHCHLNFHNFDRDRDEILERARKAGVARVLVPAIDLETSREAVALARKYDQIYASVGVHPNESETWNDRTMNELREIAHSLPDKVVAIGEIGLDYYRMRAPKALQWEVFEAQLLLAAELKLPVIIHSRNAAEDDRRAMNDILSILSNWVKSLDIDNPDLKTRAGVLHSFSGNIADARKAELMNFFMGITGPVTYKNSQTLQSVVTKSSLKSLLIETDAPFLTPHPYRGKRNEPAYVRFVAEKIAQIRNELLEQVAEITSTNAERLFNW